MRPIAALALLLALPALAAAPSAPAPAPPDPGHRVERVSEHAFAVFGRGGNVGLFVGEREAVVVDSQFDRGVPGLLEAIASATDRPLKLP